MNDVYFYNECVSIKLIDHEYSDVFASRTNHEVTFRKIIKQLMEKKFIVGDILDAGAFVGDNSMPWALLLDSQTHGVVCVDPSPKNCNFIKEMCIRNNIKNIEVIEGGLAEKSKKMYTNDDLFHCVLSESDSGKTSIDVFSIDSISNYFKNKIDFIHLDVEGQEHNCILGASETLKKYLPIICFEQHIQTDNYIETSTYLKNYGYTTYIINEILPGCRPDCRNLISTVDKKVIDNILEFFGQHIISEVVI